MQALAFPRGNIYQIVAQEGGAGLRIQSNGPKSYKHSRIIGVQPNANDLGQLFMVEKVGQGEDEYEIINCQSNLVFDKEGTEIRLEFGKQKSDQLFKVEKSGLNNAYWIKTSSKGTEALALEGVLRYKQFYLNAPNQLFYIAPVNNSEGLNNTNIILNALSGKALDVPGGTFDAGERIIQYEKNKRSNQRWRWVPSGQGHLIQNVLNGYVLDIAEDKKTSGAKVVQWSKTGGSNQIWGIVPAGQNFRIKSIHAPGQFLNIKDESIDDGESWRSRATILRQAHGNLRVIFQNDP